MDSNPELGQLLNDPALMRQSLQIASNPVGDIFTLFTLSSVIVGGVDVDHRK
jgi:hypothetical protein